MNDQQHCINCLAEANGLYSYPCGQCGWSPDQYSESGLYLSPGTILNDQYQIGRMLGHGGFGITYLAWDTLLHRRLAIKEYMPRDFATRNATNSTISIFAGEASESFAYGLERFLDEARTLAKFQQHVGIVSVLNVFYSNSTGYMVMEYVEGRTLKDYLMEKGLLPWEVTLQLFMPIMDALREVHKSGIMHRDISPDNIYLCNDNRIKLLDFGSARYALGGHSLSLSVVVKPGYAPEEQYRAKGKQGPWTDVYSVAASMYRCISGTVPPDALDRLDEDELIKPSDLGIRMPQKAETALMSALAIKSNDRTQNIETFQHAIWEQNSNNESTVLKSIPKEELQSQEFQNELTDDLKLGNDSLGKKYQFCTNCGTKNEDIAIFCVGCGANFQSQNFKSGTDSPHINESVSLTNKSVNGTNKSKGDITFYVVFIGIIFFASLYFIQSKQTKQSDPSKINNAIALYNAQDYTTAISEFNLIASSSESNQADKGQSLNYLGFMYDNGYGVNKNLQQAYTFYSKAAELGEAFSQTKLAWMYSSGIGVGQNYKKAFELYKKAADQGNAEAQNSLGWMYQNEQGIKQDYQKAFNLYQKAADQGNANAQESLGTMYRDGLGVNKDFKKALELYEKSSNQGASDGQYSLGIMYQNGYGVAQDLSKAFDLYHKSAEQGYSLAQRSLGYMYNQGIFVSANQQTAFYWYKKSADQGDASGQYSTGFLYENGVGIQQNKAEAIKWYRLAAAQGYVDASNALQRLGAK